VGWKFLASSLERMLVSGEDVSPKRIIRPKEGFFPERNIGFEEKLSPERSLLT